MFKYLILKDSPPSKQFLTFILIFIICMGISSVIAILGMLPFADIESLSDLGALNDFSNPNIILGLKIAQTISVIGTFIIPVYIFSFLTAENKASYLHLNKIPGITSLLLASFVMLSAQPLINWMGEINQRMLLPDFMSGIEDWMKASEDQAAKITEAFLKMNSVVDLIINLFVIAFLAAFAEEFFFRGILQKIFTNWTKNIHWGIWITAIIFSAFHMQFYGFLPRMMMGVLLGYLFTWSGSLWLPITAHFVNNGAAVLVSFLVQKGQIAESIDTIGSHEGETVYIFTSTLIVAGLLFLFYRIEKEKRIFKT